MSNSSIRMSWPSSRPNSILVSAMMMPRSSAYVGRGAIDRETNVGNRLAQIFADAVLHLFERDVDIMASLRLGGWRKNWLREFVGLTHPDR